MVGASVSLRAHAAAAAASSGPLRSNLGRQARHHRTSIAPGDKDRQLTTQQRTKTVPFATTNNNDNDIGETIIVASDASTSSSSSDPENILAAFAASAAAAEEAALAAAFAGTGTESSSSSSSESAVSAPAAAEPSGAPPSPPSSSAAPAPSSAGPNPALAAKIAAARAYKAAAAERAAKGDSNIGGGTKGVAPASASAAVAPPAAPVAARVAPAGPTFTRSTPPPPSKTSSSSGPDAPATPVETRGLFEGAGSETEAAAFLKGVFAASPPSSSTSSSEEGAGKAEEGEKPLDPNMRAEEFTALKTARERARGAEIITVDAGLNAAEGGSEDGNSENADGENNGYRPKVATWGVFPRPDNISKTFGGGRTIKPGDALESAEEKEARLKRQRAALDSYRKKVGLVVDPRDEAEATRLVAVGNELMRTGALLEAAAEFEKAADLLPARSAVGGRARLQRAICLDSMGKRDEAFALYKSVEGHPLDSIGKETKRMLFGFQAMEDLKAHTISYAPDKEAYAPFFGKLKSDWDTQYVSSAEEKSEGSVGALVAAVAVVAAPLLLFGALTMSK